MRRPRVLVLKVAALQVGRREVLQVVQPVVRPVELQAVQPGEALQVVPLAVQPVPVRQAQLGLEPELLEPELLQEQRLALLEPWQAQLLGLWGPLAWLVR
jgi:hypothetical protein